MEFKLMASIPHILFDVNISKYRRGQMFVYDIAPFEAKLWCDGEHIQMDRRICYLVDENRNRITHEQIKAQIEAELAAQAEAEKEAVIIQESETDDDDDKQIEEEQVAEVKMVRCHGTKNNGNRCQRSAREDIGYCAKHVYQKKT